MDDPQDEHRRRQRTELLEALRNGVVLGALVLAVGLPILRHVQRGHEAAPQISSVAPGSAPARERRVADFGREPLSADARRIARWVADSRDNGPRSFVIVDKRAARVYLFDRDAHLKAAAPAVLGSARGDDTFPGVADKPLEQLKPEERTTPAGRFVAELGESSSRGEDVVWVDYDAAVSMHRVIKAPARLNALATPDPEDNRLSNGCINVPDAFYEQWLHPAVTHGGVVFYVLPETRALRQTFASYYDVDASARVAQH